MNSLTWLTLTAASVLGALLVAVIGAILLALMLGKASSQLIHNDDLHQDY
jgi:hypothetical protein